jgi:hypothetical protein
VSFGGFTCVVGCELLVSVGQMCVVRGCFGMTGFVLLGCVLMVSRCVFVVLCGLHVMLCGLL